MPSQINKIQNIQNLDNRYNNKTVSNSHQNFLQMVPKRNILLNENINGRGVNYEVIRNGFPNERRGIIQGQISRQGFVNDLRNEKINVPQIKSPLIN